MGASVLVIDDSKTAREAIVTLLKKEGVFASYHEAVDGEAGLELLRNLPVDVVMCDVNMPGICGFEVLRILRAETQYADLPVIMLTSNGEQKDVVHGLELGASDYVTKPFDPQELIARVKTQLKIKMLQDQLKTLANTDPLTGLSNRRCLFEALTRELSRSQRFGKPCSLVMLDVDNFKNVNDRFGHFLGDEVLVAVANRLQSATRIYDLAARYGGEEFALLLPDTDSAQAFIVAERIRNQIEIMFFPDELESLKLTISAGIASFPGSEVEIVDDMVSLADRALYKAKHGGRNRVEVGL